MSNAAEGVLAPFFDRRRRFSALKTVTFFALIAPALWMAYKVSTGIWDLPSPSVNLLIQSGYWATGILLVSLAVTPFRKIFRQGELIRVRRMIGLVALVYSIAHLMFYFAVRLWDFRFMANEFGTRPTIVIATVSMLGLIALGVTSFDAAIRWMGGRNWNRLHNVVYIVTALAILHLLLSLGSLSGLPFTLTGYFFWLMAWRALDRFGFGDRPMVLALLAVGAALFTALFEAIWLWAYQGSNAPGGGSPLATLRLNFDVEWWGIIGLPPTWKVLLVGLAIAAAAALWQKFGSRVPRATTPRPWSTWKGKLVIALCGAVVGGAVGIILNPAPPPDPFAGINLDIFGGGLGEPAQPTQPAPAEWPRIADILAYGAAGAIAGVGLGALADRRTRKALSLGPA